MAKTYSAGGVAHDAKYWRLTIDVRESDGERRRLTKTTQIACAKNSTRGRSPALTVLRQWRGERGLGPASRNAKHGVLAMVCKYAAARGANVAALRRKGVQAVLWRIPPRTGKKDGGDPRCLG